MSAMSLGMNLGTAQAKLRMLLEDVTYHREMKNLLHSLIHVCREPQFGRFNDTIQVSLNRSLFKPRGMIWSSLDLRLVLRQSCLLPCEFFLTVTNADEWVSFGIQQDV